MRFLLSSFLFRRTRRNERGAVLIVGIVACLMAISFAALGVDIGRIAVDKKNDQKVADLAALDAARALGFILNTTNQAGYDAAAQTAASASAVRNGFTANGTTHTVTATTGSLNASHNFVQDGSAGAVQVIVRSRLVNQFVSGSKDLSATAVALVGAPIAGFSVGSTLANLDAAATKPTLTSMLASMLGVSNASLSLVSYQGLAGANLSLARLQTALLAAGLNVGTPTELLNTDIKVSDLLTATASALTAQGSNAAAAEVNDFPIASIPSVKTVKLGSLLNVANPGDSSALSGTFNVFTLITGAAELSNGTTFVSLPVAANLGGLANVSMAVSVIAPATTAIGPVGTTAENAQVALRVGLRVGAGLLLTPVDIDLTFTSGQAKGTLTSIVCGASPSIGVSVNTAAVTVTGTATAPLTGTLTVLPSAIGGTGPNALSFAYPSEFAPPTTKHVGATTAGLTLTTVSFSGTGLVAGLITALLNPLGPVFASALTTLNNALNTAVTPVLKSLGLNLASADVAALGIFPDPASCGGHPRLAK